MKIAFSKYQGTGNDFVMIDNRQSVFPAQNTGLVKKLCDRRFGIGADGLILLDYKPGGMLRMTYFNSDGNLSSMCGNGGRCFAAFAKRCGIPGEEISFEAADGIHTALFTGTSPVTVKMTMGDVTTVETGSDFMFLDTGSPHVVKFVSEVNKLDVKTEGRVIRNSARFRVQGTNVNFVEPAEGYLFVRTYERGVEDETWSCGTGVTASVLAAAASKKLEGKQESAVQTPGGKLKVYFSRNGNGFREIWLEGEASFVFEGEVEI